MRSPNLQLSIRDQDVITTPMPGASVCQCTAASCRNLATHRILTRQSTSVEFLCDEHTYEWALERGIHISRTSTPNLAA